MACCAVVGQGAGISAAFSIKNKCGLAEVDVPKAQAMLAAQGVRTH